MKESLVSRAMHLHVLHPIRFEIRSGEQGGARSISAPLLGTGQLVRFRARLQRAADETVQPPTPDHRHLGVEALADHVMAEREVLAVVEADQACARRFSQPPPAREGKTPGNRKRRRLAR